MDSVNCLNVFIRISMQFEDMNPDIDVCKQDDLRGIFTEGDICNGKIVDAL